MDYTILVILLWAGFAFWMGFAMGQNQQLERVLPELRKLREDQARQRLLCRMGACEASEDAKA